MGRRSFSVAVLCPFVICLWTIVSDTATAKCNIYEWDQLGSLGVLAPTCFGFPLEGFRVFIKCSTVMNMKVDLREVPVDVDTLCLVLNVPTVPTDSFSRYQNLTRLYLYGSFHVSARAFNGAANLRHLGIKGDTRHTPPVYMDVQVFGGLENLTRLDLQNLVIHSEFQQSIFKPLHRIQVISLYDNDCRRLSRLTTLLQSLESLEVLEIMRNGITRAREEDCISTDNLSKLPGHMRSSVFSPRISTLDLSGNELERLEKNAFCNFPHLTVFRADHAALKVIQLVDSGIKHIATLSLNAMINTEYLEIKDVCNVVSQLKVSYLSVAQNFIFELSTKSFEGCDNLLLLNMSDNFIKAFTSDMAKKLLSLRSLILSVNKIKSLDICPPGTHPKVLLANLTHLDLSTNRISSIGSGRLSCLSNLRTLDISQNHIPTLEKDAFMGLEQLESLNLSSNGLFLLENFYFDHLTNVRILDLMGNQLRSDNGSYIGMHRLEEMRLTFKDVPGFAVLQNPLTYLAAEGPSIYLECQKNGTFLKVLHIKADYVVIDLMAGSPLEFVEEVHLLENQHLECRAHPDPEPILFALTCFTNLEHLYYSSSGLMHQIKNYSPLNGSLPLLRKLRHLHLKNLKLDIEKGFLTPEQLFWNLTHLRTLILEDSGIEHFTATMFRDLVSLELVVFKSQPVKTLQEGLLDHTESLRYIYLKDVPLDCLCEQAWIRRWVTTHPQVRVPQLGIQTCSIGPQKLNYLKFMEKDCSLLIGYPLFVGTFSFNMLFLITALLYHRVRWYLLYLFYMLRTWWNYRGRHDRKRQYDFDAFVSYSSCDEAWVVREFLPNLEELGPPFFKVCLHGRDFEVGKDILDNIMDSIYRSRWVVCLISRHYLRSHWCSLEVRMATYRLLAERKDSLVMVFLEKVSMRSLSRYHQLAKLVKKKTYLEWEEDLGQQPLFWARLRKAIGGDGAEQQDIIVK
ncbi:toll-like receptor 11 [Lissotriton helveticus]